MHNQVMWGKMTGSFYHPTTSGQLLWTQSVRMGDISQKMFKGCRLEQVIVKQPRIPSGL